MQLDDSQKKFSDTKARNTRLLAPAGSGKTQSLLWLCRRLYEQKGNKPCKFLIFTFTRVARNELKDRLHQDSNFSIIKRAVRIDTLNQWGYNYLRRNVEPSLVIKATKKDLFFLVRNLLRPIWIDNPFLRPSLEKKQWKYSQIIEIFDALKSCGFRHDVDDLSLHFESQVKWLEKNGCYKYFECKVYNQLVALELIESNVKGLFDQFKTFLQFWKEACVHLWKSAVLSLDDQKYWALIKLQEKYGAGAFPELNRNLS